jgi:hemerythrin
VNKPSQGEKMQYEWSSELEIGCPNIDDQHKQLIVALNDLLAACEHGGHRSELKSTVDFLVAYTVKHFADEEEFQIKHNYPDYERHKQLHDEFKAVASDLAGQLMQEGATIALVAKVHSTIGDWLVNHIKGEDRKVAAHAQGQA